MNFLVGAFNQEKAIVGPSSWLWNLREPSFNLRFKLYHLRLILVAVLGWGREGWCASRWEPGAGHLTLGWALGDNLLFPFLKKVSQQWPMTQWHMAHYGMRRGHTSNIQPYLLHTSSLFYVTTETQSTPHVGALFESDWWLVLVVWC